jgi:hypothetical protein
MTNAEVIQSIKDHAAYILEGVTVENFDKVSQTITLCNIEGSLARVRRVLDTELKYVHKHNRNNGNKTTTTTDT